MVLLLALQLLAQSLAIVFELVLEGYSGDVRCSRLRLRLREGWGEVLRE
jgi:hypothetical protein